MTDFTEILTKLDDLNITDIEKHRKALSGIAKYLTNTYSQAPIMLLENYVKLSETIEGFRAKNPKADLTIYDNVLKSMQLTLIYIEQFADVYHENEYLKTMIDTQTKMIDNMQRELMQWNGIESALYDGTLKAKITTVIKKFNDGK